LDLAIVFLNCGAVASESRLNSEEMNVAFRMAEGVAFEMGIERKKNCQKAFELYKSAAEHGTQTAMVCIGLIFKIGKGCHYNFCECVKHLKRAADFGDRYGIRKIGLCSKFGEGFEKNKVKAREW
jgi:TPR repeat protein